MAQEGKKRPIGFLNSVDASAIGFIYGSVTALALLMALGPHPERPLTSAAVLFGSVLAISLAKAFAEVMSNAIDSGERITGSAISASWHHARVTLIAANLPTLLHIAAGFGLWSIETASELSQGYCTAHLMPVGARVGWRVEGRAGTALLGALASGGVGLALAGMKYVLH